MIDESLQDLCARGQQQLMEMQYLEAEQTLERAERRALAARDWDALSRLYMPLQETRRQRRQRCGEGIVRLDLVAENQSDHIEARHVLENYPHGQLLVAGWGTIEPAVQFRALAAKHGLYAETFLAAVYPVSSGRAVVIVPTVDAALPTPEPRSREALVGQLPAGSLVLVQSELPRGSRKGTYETYGEVMALWERLHAPFLEAADRETEPLRKIEMYRQTIAVDYACELAHQGIAAVARELDRQSK
jgi:hypothetical protein